MSVYISSLPVYTGTAADLRWFIMNNSGETTTFKYSGYSSQLIPGTGANSYRTPTQTASGLRSIAIGEGASASGEDSVSIGNANTNSAGYRSVSIGRHPYAPGDNNTIIGSGAYIYGNNSIAIGQETSTNSNGIVLGGNTSRANGNYAITLGNQNEQNNSAYSTILGTNNRIGASPSFNGSPYSTVIGTNNILETDAGYYYNTIINGFGNTITGSTSGATLINTSGITSVGKNDIIIGTSHTSNQSGYRNTLIAGEGNSIASTDASGKNTIIGGNGNSIPTGFGNGIFNGIGATIQANQSTIAGAQGTITDGFGNGLFGGVGNVGGNYSVIAGGYSNTIGGVFNDRCFIGGGGNNTIGNSANSALIAAYGNTLTSGYEVFIAGTESNTLTSAGYTFTLVGGGYNTINNTGQSGGNAMYSSYFCSDTTANDTSIIGSSNNWFSGTRNGTMSGYGKHNHITNSYSSTITNNPSADVFEWFNKIDSSSGSTITTSKQSQILGGIDNTISGKTRSVMIGCSGRTATTSGATFVENLVVFNYAGLNFADDTAAAAGGVVLGQVYHNNGAMRIRIV